VQASTVTPQQCFFESWVGAEKMIKVGGWLVGKQRYLATEWNNSSSLPSLPLPLERPFSQALTVTGLACRCWRIKEGVAEDLCLTSFKLNRELILTAPRLRPFLLRSLATVDEKEAAGSDSCVGWEKNEDLSSERRVRF
jgi:hypothetical protein